MAETALVPYDAQRARAISIREGQQRTSRLVRRAESSVRVRDDEEDGLEARRRTLALQSSVTVLSEVYLKIGTHWSPIDGNAAGEYGFDWVE